jgi:hypothetical protein
MKKLLYIIFAFGLIVQSCNNNDFEYKFDKTPDKRIKEKVDSYYNILTSSEYGWKTLYYPNEDEYGGYQFLISFDEKGNASIISDLKGERDTSLYKIKAEQDLMLIFDTSSQFHILTDPSKDNPGKGVGGDFEFLFEEVSNEKIVLKGKIGGSEMILYPAGKSTEDEIKNMNIFTKLILNDPGASFFREINTTKGFERNISFSYFDNREVKLAYKNDNGKVIIEDRKIYFTNQGFSLKNPIFIKGMTLEKFEYSVDSKLFNIIDSEIEGSIKYSNTPIFAVNGAADAFLSHNFYALIAYSNPLMEAYEIIKQNIPGIYEFQLYTKWGYFLAFNPDIQSKWAGFSGITFGKAGEDLIINTWTNNAYGDWWQALYYAPENAGQLFITILTDPQGMYIFPYRNDFYLISKTYPNHYFRITPK